MLGVGSYSVPEAARLIGAQPASLRRWVLGYQKHRDHAYPPLWKLQYEVDEVPALGFRDLIEARMVNSLRKAGISLQAIRLCLSNAHNIIAGPHIFSSAHFRTDGRTVWMELTKDVDQPELIDLSSRQQVFHNVVEPSFRDLEFDNEAAIRWWPLPDRRSIVIDPGRAFGQPILAETGMATARIAEAFLAEGQSVTRLAKLYEISPQAIRDALAFEKRLSEQSADVSEAA